MTVNGAIAHNNSTTKNGLIKFNDICQFDINNVQYMNLPELSVYPLPVRDKIITNFNLVESGNVCLSIFNNLGEENYILFQGNQEKGKYTFENDVRFLGISQGIYFIRLTSGKLNLFQKILIIP